MKYKLRSLTLILLGLLLWGGCSSSLQTKGQSEKEIPQVNKTDSTPSAKADPYSTNLDELKKEFNADKGKVRLVTLLSPT